MTLAERVRGWSGRGVYPTLGWGVLDWMTEHLPSPSDHSAELVLTDEQALIVRDFYRLDPATGDFTHRRARLEMAKGWGKSPLLAAVALAEFAGPVRFGGWDDDGEPAGVPVHNPIVEIAAVSLDQADNTWAALYEMLAANDGRAARELGIDAGRTRMYLTGGRPGHLKAVTAESSSREGQRLTFAVLDETHLWRRDNGGVRLAAVLRRNAAKMDGRTFETTNAPVTGQGSVAEESGDAPVPGVLHVCRRAREAPERDWHPERLRAELAWVYGDSWWAPVERILSELADPATDWDDALRFYFNLRSSGRSRAADPEQWDRLARPEREVPPGARVGLGFDGSVSLDSTVLRACTADGFSFSLPGWSWVRPTGDAMRAWALAHAGQDWRVPRDLVDEAVAQAFERFDVGLMRADPPFWGDEITRWQRLYGAGVVVPFNTNSARQMGAAFDGWATAVREGTHTHDGDPVVTEQVKAMHKRPATGGQRGDDGRALWVPVKGEDRAKIDGGLADILARHAAAAMPDPVVAPERTGPSAASW